MTDLQSKTITKNDDNYVETEVDGEKLLMRIDEGFFYTMNVTSEAFWKGIDIEPNIGKLYAKIAEQFNVTLEECRADLDELVEEFEKHQLVSIA